MYASCIVDKADFSVEMFDSPESAVPESFKVYANWPTTIDDVYLVTGLVVGVDDDFMIQVLKVGKDMEVQENTSINLYKFEQLKERYGFVAVGEVM